MNSSSFAKTSLCFCFALLTCVTAANASVYDINYKLSATTTTLNPSAVTIAAPSGYSYSAAAPVSGTTWNVVDKNAGIPAGQTAGSTYTYSANNQAASGVVKDAAGNTLSGVGLTITYTAVAANGNSEPLTMAGENTIQPGGVMQYGFRNYNNSAGNYYTFSFTGLPVSTPFDLYIYGGTTTTAQGTGVSLNSGNVLGANPSTATTPNATANSAGSYGSIFTGTSPNYSLMASGTTWAVVHGQSDSSGNFAFQFKKINNNNQAYLNGFQLVRVPVTTYTITPNGSASDCTSVNIGLSGSETGVKYQVYRNNGGSPVTVGSAVSGTGSAITSLTTATVSDTYTVVGTVSDGTSTGLSATMTGSASVTILAATTVGAASVSPSSSVSVGANVTISVTTGGTAPTTYVWKKNGTTLNNGDTGNGGSTYSGATTATLTINNAQIGDSATTGHGYTCTVSGGCGSPTSTEATLSVTSGNTSPTIAGLTNQTVLAGNNATLSAVVGGTPSPGLQWYSATGAGVVSNAIAGQTGSSLTLTNVQYTQNGYVYYLLASNSVATVVSNMTLTVTQTAPTISGLTNQTVNAGFNAPLNATVNGAPVPSLQWLLNGTPITSATNSTLILTNVHESMNGNVYSLVATNTAGILTNSLTLTVTNLQLCINLAAKGSTGANNYSGTAAAPDTGTLWNDFATPGSGNTVTMLNATNSLGGNTTASVTLSSSGSVFNWYNDTTSGSPNPANLMSGYLFGNTYVVTVSNLLQGTYALYDYAHGNALNQNATVTISAGNGGGSAATTSSATYTSNYRDTTAGSGVAYVVLNGNVGSAEIFTFTNATYLNGFQLQYVSVAGVSGLTNRTVVAGTSPVLNPTITGTAPLTYQWYSNNVVITGATASTLALNNVQYAQNGAIYSLIVSNAAGADTNSMALSVIVTPSIATIPNQAIGVTSNTTISASVSGVPTPSVWWQFNGTNLVNGTTGWGSVLSGSATATLNLSNAQTNDSGIYSLVASNSAGMTTNSMTLTVANSAAPVIAGLVGQTVIQGSNATFSASVSGFPLPTLQWLDQTQTPIAGATSSTLTLTNVQYSQNGYTYYLVASNSVGIVTNSATLTVWVPVSIATQPTNLAVVVGSPAAFSVIAGGVPAPSYQWNRNGSPISGATGATYTLANPQGADNGAAFTVTVSNAVNVVTSGSATLTVLSTMTGAFGPTNGAVNISPDQQLRIVFSGGTPFLNTNGTLTVRDAANNSVVQMIDASQFLSYTPGNTSIQTIPNAAIRTVQGSYSGSGSGSTTYYYMPIALYGNQAWITLTNRLAYGHTYYVNCDTGLFLDSNGASFVGISGTNTWVLSTKASGPATPTTNSGPTSITIGQDGAGDFATFQGAFDWIPASNTLARTVHVLPGIYRDSATLAGNRNFVTIVGDGASRTNAQLIYPFAYFAPPNPVFTAGSLRIESSDVAVENLTLDNIIYGVYHPTGYATSGAPTNFAGAINTLATTGKRIVFDNVLIKGGQDTIYNISGIVYYHNCEVWGSVDFIYGAALGVFDQCNIVEIRSTGGPCTAPNTPYAQPYGMTFLNCAFPQALVANGYPYDVGAATTTFMRPWGQDGMTAAINCAIGSQFSTMAYQTFGNTNEDTCRAREYGTTMIGGGSLNVPQIRWGAGAYWVNTIDPDYTNNPSLLPTDPLLAPPTGTNNRVVVTVNPSDYTLSAIFGNSYFNLNGWSPAPAIAVQPINQSVSFGQSASFTVVATGAPTPNYQWLMNGSPIGGATNATLTIASAVRTNGGTYSVIVSNSVSTVTSSNAVLTYINTAPVAQTMTVARTAGLALRVALSDVATNWSDVDGDTVSLSGINLVTTNGVNLMTNSSWIFYTNSPNLNDQISYTIGDGYGGSAVGYINIVVTNSVTGMNSITGYSFSSTSNLVTAFGIPGYYYILERATNLAPADWVQVSTNVTATNGVINAVDMFNDLGGAPPSSAYYRLKWQP